MPELVKMTVETKQFFYHKLIMQFTTMCYWVLEEWIALKYSFQNPFIAQDKFKGSVTFWKMLFYWP